MKSAVTTFIVAMMCALSVQLMAQGFLISGGLNLSKLYITVDGEDYSGNMRIQPGFQIGGYYELPTGKRFSFVPGISLSLRGIKEKGEVEIDDQMFDYVTTLNILYVDVPITFRRYFYEVGAGPFVNFGCQFGYGFYAWEKDKLKSGTVTSKNVYRVEFDDYISQFDAELILGTGICMFNLEFGFQYEMGLVDVIKGLPSNVGARHMVFAFYASYHFPHQTNLKNQ